MNRRLGVLAFGAGLSIFVACVSDAPSSPPTAGGGDDDGGGSSDSGLSTLDAESDGGSVGDAATVTCPSGQSACGTTCADLKSTDENCGKCGHSCGGVGCVNSRCNATDVLTGLNSPTGIATSNGTDQFIFNAGGVISRCAKTGCANAATKEWSGATYKTQVGSPLTISNGQGGGEGYATLVNTTAAPSTQLFAYGAITQGSVATDPAFTTPPQASLGYKNMAGDDVKFGGYVAMQGDYDVVGCPLGVCGSGN
ncbi:MAG: hypothetical protein ABI461_13710, partial [Polyangiaceae bacterium]